MLGSLRALPGRVATTVELSTRLPHRGTKGALVGGGKVCVVEKYFSQPLLVSPSLSYWLSINWFEVSVLRGLVDTNNPSISVYITAMLWVCIFIKKK